MQVRERHGGRREGGEVTQAPIQTPHPERDRALRERYGFGLFPLPGYRPAAVGDWRVARYGPAPVEGYLPGTVLEPCRHVLHRGRTPWMSSSLMEQESHAFHVRRAEGLVVAAGLGMALYAYAASLKREVERVVVVEREPEVIALLREASGLEGWPGRGKVTILQADALGPELPRRVAAAAGGRRPDYLYADIWPELGAEAAPGETAALVEALAPEAAGWWGQELSFGRWCREAGRTPDAAALGDFAGRTGVPIPAGAGYARFCRDVARARVPRRRLRRLWRRVRGG